MGKIQVNDLIQPHQGDLLFVIISDPDRFSVMLRVLRWRRRTPSRSSIRATALPTADDDTPSWRPATVKLRASAA